MKGLILINAYPNGEKFYRQAERIAAELFALGVQTDIVKNGELPCLFDEDGRIKTTESYSFAVYLDKDKYLGRMLEKTGLRLFNKAEAVEVCDDKASTYLALAGSGLRFPKTIAAPLCYTKGARVNEIFLKNVEKTLGFPLVVKKSYGSFGEGVRLVKNGAELRLIAQEWISVPHFYQSFVEEAAGCDLRVIVIGGKALGAMERVASEGEFRSNIELGGTGRKKELKEEYREAAERAASSLCLDYCGVDLLQTKEGPVLCEVNSNAFFEGFESVTGLNVAKAYAEYIVKTIKK